jgi:hypothetical protein
VATDQRVQDINLWEMCIDKGVFFVEVTKAGVNMSR